MNMILSSKMSSKGQWILVLLVAVLISGSGCKNAASSSRTGNGGPGDAATPKSGAPDSPAGAASPGTGAINKPPAQVQWLEGVYVIAEVQEKQNGKIDMVPAGSQVTLTFMQDGTFTRSSNRKGKAFHKDAGNYTLAKDQLTLTATISEKDILQAPMERAYTFSISPDGDELKLTGVDGKVALFRRKARAASKQ
jgi:hypothetical protein